MKQLLFLLTALALLTAGCSEQIIDKEPVVRFLISGKVVDPDALLPVAGIQVRPCVLGWEWSQTDLFVDIGAPALTDENGEYQFDIISKPWSDICVVAQDIDGPENGAFDDSSYVMNFIDYSSSHLVVSDSTWDFGTATITMPTLRLKKK